MGMKSFADAIKYITVCLLAGLLGSCAEDKNSLCPTGVLYLNVEEDETCIPRRKRELLSSRFG